MIGTGVVLTAAAVQAQDFTLTIFHNNDGESDLRLFPEDEGGSVDWPGLMRSVRGLDSSPLLVLDSGEDVEEAAPLEKARRVFDRLESLAD